MEAMCALYKAQGAGEWAGTGELARVSTDRPRRAPRCGCDLIQSSMHLRIVSHFGSMGVPSTKQPVTIRRCIRYLSSCSRSFLDLMMRPIGLIT